jgi:hypothetical protein
MRKKKLLLYHNLSLQKEAPFKMLKNFFIGLIYFGSLLKVKPDNDIKIQIFRFFAPEFD